MAGRTDNVNAASSAATVYTVKEFAEAHQSQFGCSQDMVVAAFMHAGKKEATLKEAKTIIENFRKREVK